MSTPPISLILIFPHVCLINNDRTRHDAFCGTKPYANTLVNALLDFVMLFIESIFFLVLSHNHHWLIRVVLLLIAVRFTHMSRQQSIIPCIGLREVKRLGEGSDLGHRF